MRRSFEPVVAYEWICQVNQIRGVAIIQTGCDQAMDKGGSIFRCEGWTETGDIA